MSAWRSTHRLRARIHRQPLRRLVLAGGMSILAAGVLWRIVIGPPTFPPITASLPAYLAPSNPIVRSAAEHARTRAELRILVRDALLRGMPPSDALWTTHGLEFGTESAAALWEDGRKVRFLTYPPEEMPEDPTWDERPDHNLSVETLYQSLSWLQAPARAFEETRDPAYQQQVRHYLLSWITAADRHPKPSVRTWYDGAVGYRTDVIVQLFKPVLADVLTANQLDTVLGSLEKHGSLLYRYLSEARFVGHNHALFHALSLYNLAVAFPVLRHADEWRTAARRRISTLMPEMVAPREGVSLEESASYHFLALRLFADADAFLRKHGDGLTASELRVLDRMTAFGALLQTPMGVTPAIGDTGFGTPTMRYLVDLAHRGFTSPTARYVLSRGAAGSRPPDASFYPVAGYAIVRPEYTPDHWADDVQLIVDTSTRTRAHGHYDAMNVLLAARGAQLLVDSGGPYRYGDPQRDAFVSAAAHNVVTADGSEQLGAVSHLVERDDSTATVIAGTTRIGDGARDRRIVVLVKPDLLVVVDRVRATDGRSHRYDLRYHLSPGADVVLRRDRGVARVAGAAVGFRIVSSAGAPIRIVKGARHPLVGWVTTDVIGLKKAAPVLTMRQRGERGWFVAAFQPATRATARPPSVVVTPRARGGLDVGIVAGSVRSTLVVTARGQVRLAG